MLTSPGTRHTSANGLRFQSFPATAVDCDACKLKLQCLKGALKPNDGRGRQVTRFEPKTKDPCHRGSTKVNTQRHLYCMVHNIEKLAKPEIGPRAG